MDLEHADMNQKRTIAASEGVGLKSEQLVTRMSTWRAEMPVLLSSSATEPNMTISASARVSAIDLRGGSKWSAGATCVSSERPLFIMMRSWKSIPSGVKKPVIAERRMKSALEIWRRAGGRKQWKSRR